MSLLACYSILGENDLLFFVLLFSVEFKEMLDNTEKNATLKRMDFQQTNYKQRLSAPDLENSFPPAGILSDNALLPSPQDFNKKNNSHKKDRSFMMTIASSKPRLRKALRNFFPRNMSASSMNRSVYPW
jgi:hypothetical protein